MFTAEFLGPGTVPGAECSQYTFVGGGGSEALPWGRDVQPPLLRAIPQNTFSLGSQAFCEVAHVSDHVCLYCSTSLFRKTQPHFEHFNSLLELIISFFITSAHTVCCTDFPLYFPMLLSQDTCFFIYSLNFILWGPPSETSAVRSLKSARNVAVDIDLVLL